MCFVLSIVVVGKHVVVKTSKEKILNFTDPVYNFAKNDFELIKSLDHPSIAKMIDFIVDEHIIIVQELVEGEVLDVLLRKNGVLSPDLVIGIAKQVCSFLDYLHSHNPPYIYQDMKLANLILKSNGEIIIVDFHTLSIYEPNRLSGITPLGTRGYAAPEQYGIGQIDIRTDIYGLGMAMHYLLTGVDPSEPPYETKLICQINPSLPKGLEYIVNKCIQINPQDRYQTCEELLFDLDNYMNLPKPKPKGFLKKLFEKNKDL